MEKDDEKVIDPVVNTEDTVVDAAENPILTPAEDVTPTPNGEGEVIDDNTEIEPEDTSIEPVTEPTVEPVVPPVEDDGTFPMDPIIPPAEDATLAPTDDIIPAPVENPVEDAPLADIVPPMADIPVDPAPVVEPVIDEPVVSDVRPDVGDETPCDIPVDAPVEAPCEECPTDIAVPGECPNCDEPGCPGCEPSAPVSVVTAANIFGTLQECVTITWRFHLKTRKHHVHVTLNEFYDKALDIVDDIIEQYQGVNGVIDDVFTNCVVGDGKTEIEYLNELKTFIENNKTIICINGGLQSVVDEFIGLIDSTLYKLTSFTENAVKSFEEFCYEDLNEYRVYNKYGDLVSDEEEDEKDEERQDDNGNPGKPGPGGESVDEEEDPNEEEE